MDEDRALDALRAGDEDALAWFIERYTAYVSTIVKNMLLPRLPEADADFLTDFYMYAIAGVMIGWFAGDMREEPEELVGRLSRLLEGEFRRSAEKFAPEETAV